MTTREAAHSGPQAAGLLLIIVLAAAASGCAVMNRDNTPLLNFVEDDLWPESAGARIAVFPLVLPAGVIAVVGDALIVHPAGVIGDAWEDTGDLLWDYSWYGHYMTQCAALPWRAACTPVVFAGDFLGRALFDIPRRAEKEREGKEDKPETRAEPDKYHDLNNRVQAVLDEAERHLARGEPSRALDGIDSFVQSLDHQARRRVARDSRQAASIVYLTLEAAHGAGRYEALWNFRLDSWQGTLGGRTGTGEADEILDAMLESNDPYVRWSAVRFGIRFVYGGDRQADLIRRAMADPDRVVRILALSCIEKNESWIRRLLPDVKRMAAEDDDPIIRAFAGELAPSFE